MAAIVFLAIAFFILLVAYLGVSFVLLELWEENRPTKRPPDKGGRRL